MADYLPFLIAAVPGVIVGAAALYNSKTQHRESTEEISQKAFDQAKGFYDDTVKAYREELNLTRVELSEARKELRDSKVDREYLSMRVTMLEADKDTLEKKIVRLEKAQGLIQPPNEES